MTVDDRCCDDIAVHSHDGGTTLRRNGRPYTYRCAFEWRLPPKLVAYRTADRYRLKFILNRYPGVVIGAGVVIGNRAFGVVWGRPGRIIEEP